MSKYAPATQTFILNQRSGMLASHSVANPGYPLGSVVPYDVDQESRLIIYISYIAEHYRNLSANPHACLLICHPLGVEDPQLYARASVLIDFTNVTDDQRANVQTSYEKRFPAAINYEIAHNFTFMRGTIARIRWIGGFGEIGWVSGEETKAWNFDQTAYCGHEIVNHMNQDHSDTLKNMARAFFSAKEVSAPQMLSINAKGFEFEWIEAGLRRIESISFESPLTSPSAARPAMIALSQKAKALLGANI